MHYGSVIRNKPRQWAADRRNLPAQLQQTSTPSRSQFCRRLNTPAVRAMLDELEQAILDLQTAALIGCWLLDAKPFVVSPYSKDKQAKRGWAYNGYARGYKLFAMSDPAGNVVSWRVDSMNVAEPAVARERVQAIDRPGYLIGDSIYDSNRLHETTAALNVQMIAPRKQPGGNIGRRARYPHRLHAIELLETPHHSFGPSMYAKRTEIERMFSQMASSRVGLDHLPGFIRTLPRVRRWIQAKIVLYHLIREKN